MTTLLLIRHADTDAVGNTLAGWQAGWHLNPRGLKQAEGLTKNLAALPIRAIYSSPLERCRETAEALAKPHGLKLNPRTALGEMRMGTWEGRRFDELAHDEQWRRFNEFRSGTRAPNGESMLETQARMVSELECIAQSHDGELAAVVSHADPLRSALAHYLGMPLDSMQRFELVPASVSVVLVSAGPPVVRCLNYTGGLPL